MKKAYMEDNGDEFPINNLVRCGQTPYVAEFGGAAPAEEPSSRVRTPVPTGLVKSPYFPKARPRLKKQA
ncbi:hypothetical protein CCU68_12190 [Pseudomonas gingeri NCPPB 3146 = LMG 5327]|uniref:Uncharacterized protein n=2 Tax=Pseudomonas gingeri TaxID=117681 RepID=A0A7Y8CBM7_9PSED|nr:MULTISPECIES: hypothetical protein [Pseudomonas]NVZ29454.1 hypothetical protein [Pseudomonas gingeri]NVZ64868.1 hypothetical protein [Pseudomonas gingeri]NVZ75076.1 hypothetical protein [Pseudomonas gingeri]NWA01039.1 hypothetical protein [Pseudomonas gingeri]NWA08695.1 hypothetical protein [Pseudomonas gingeri]